MPFALTFPEMVADLNARLAPSGYALVEHPEQAPKVLLTHPGIEEVIRTRAFLNHGLGGHSDSCVVLGLSARRTELVLECNFEAVLSLAAFDAPRLAEALREAGEKVLARHRQFLAESNPLHQKLLEYREAITQAGFHLEPSHFVTNLETHRELKRTTPDRVDRIGVAVNEEGQLVATRLDCVFTNPIPFGTALKVMGLGLGRG